MTIGWHRCARTAVVLAMAIEAAACTAPTPSPKPLVPIAYPQAARERFVALALAEWRDWGEVDVAGWATLPPGRESRPENFPRVLAYWAAVPEGPAVIARERSEFVALSTGLVPTRPLWQEPPWSAAFVSYLARNAGIDRPEFPPAAAHSTYVDALIGQALAFPDGAPFVPHAPAARSAAVGDLLCADRAPVPLPHWTARLAEAGRFRPMHCDVVVAAGPGEVAAIGGNVGDAVVRRRFPADAAGIVHPAPAGMPPFVLLLQNRLGRLPPWGAVAGS